MTTATEEEKHAPKLVLRSDGQQWDRIVMAEVVVPDVPNVYGDIYTLDAIREMMEQFAIQGFGIDVNHDNVDISNSVYVVESFIARPGDPDFIVGSWVVGVKVLDDALWQRILDGEINGFSYEALMVMLPVAFQHLRNRVVVGVTAPDPTDGHTHSYSVVLNALNRPIAGGTGETNGHTHTISTHTITDAAQNGLFGATHVHRYQVLDIEEFQQ